MKGIKIVILSLDDNEEVQHRLLLVKGKIVHVSHKTDLLNCDNLVIHCSNGPSKLSWPVHHGKFKCLTWLEYGSNHVTFEFYGFKEEVRVTYEPRHSKYYVTPLYIVCSGHDGSFQSPSGVDNSIESAVQRIGLGARLIQSLYAEKLRERGYGRKTFLLEQDITNGVGCQVLFSKLNVEEARGLNENELWVRIAREIMGSEFAREESKFLGFLSCTLWDGNNVSGDCALGGGGLALLGSACLHTWPSSIQDILPAFSNQEKLQSFLFDNSCFRGTYAGCFTTTLGSACHELGHTFDLGHPGTGIMGRGFDHVDLVFLTKREPLSPTKLDNGVGLIPEIKVSFAEGELVNRAQKDDREDLSTKWMENDMSHFSPGCGAILAHHKWFNVESKDLKMIFDPTRSLLTSEAGIRVVQIRGEKGHVWKSWQINSVRMKHMVIPRHYTGLTLFAMDNCGSILNTTL